MKKFLTNLRRAFSCPLGHEESGIGFVYDEPKKSPAEERSERESDAAAQVVMFAFAVIMALILIAIGAVWVGFKIASHLPL